VEVSVVIPARDAAATLPATLAALSEQVAAPAFEVLVIDDGSADATVAAVSAAPLEVRLLRTAGGEGPAAARNRGAAAARGRLLAFTDADCAPEPGWLAALARAASGADLVQGAVLPPRGVPVGPFDRTISVVTMHGLFETANLAISREWFERLGGFESILRPRFGGKELGEDVWLGWRARRGGARAVFEPQAIVRHAVFERGAARYVAERARVRYFPALVARIPELREEFLHRRCFLNARTLRFDAALASVAVAAGTRRPWPLLAALPYARRAWRDSSGWGRRRRPLVLGAQVAADAVGAAALAAGSIRHRAVVA
jgi:glycosyltransferase involved in cell wall biosynthesis